MAISSEVGDEILGVHHRVSFELMQCSANRMNVFDYPESLFTEHSEVFSVGEGREEQKMKLLIRKLTAVAPSVLFAEAMEILAEGKSFWPWEDKNDYSKMKFLTFTALRDNTFLSYVKAWVKGELATRSMSNLGLRGRDPCLVPQDGLSQASKRAASGLAEAAAVLRHRRSSGICGDSGVIGACERDVGTASQPSSEKLLAWAIPLRHRALPYSDWGELLSQDGIPRVADASVP